MDKEFKLACNISLIIIICFLLNSMLGDWVFRLRYSSPKLSYTTKEIIDVKKTPVQVDINRDDFIKAKGEKKIYALKPQAEYSLTGLVVAKNTNFFLRDLMRSDFDDLFLMDVGIVWGEIATKEYIKEHLKFKSTKTLGGARQLQPSTKDYHKMPYKWSYVSNHMSHTHLTPATVNVMSALLKIKKYDVVKLDGYLVDIYTDKNEVVALTSLSRDDNNAQSRGYGACEDFYVKQVQIGDKVYK